MGFHTKVPHRHIGICCDKCPICHRVCFGKKQYGHGSLHSCENKHVWGTVAQLENEIKPYRRGPLDDLADQLNTGMGSGER